MSYEQWPYLGVLFVLLAASVGLPIPEDIPLLTGGYLCHIGKAHLPIMIAVGMTGVLSGDIFLFLMGRRFGHRIVEHRFVCRLVNAQRLLLAEELFAKHGVKILFIGRFLPGLRPMIFMAAGVLRVPVLTFIAVNGLAASISVPTLVVLGRVFGGSLEQIKSDVRTATHAVGVAVLIAAVVGGGIWLHRRQKRLMAETHLPPVQADDLVNIAPSPAALHAAESHRHAHESRRPGTEEGG